jgi:hypothetical protein
MMSAKKQPKTGDKDEEIRYHVRLPGFITDTDIGLGDVIKKVTYTVGIQPCAGCEKRAASLNRWMQFSSR